MSTGTDLIKSFEEKGTGNEVLIGPGSSVWRLMIIGHNNRIEIGRKCQIGGYMNIKCNNSRLIIGDATTVGGFALSMHETGTIRIGADCMFAGDLRMDVSDMHSIIDLESGQRINPARDIDIGDHVWIGQDCFIAKGCVIGRDSIIGAKSFVAGTIPPNVVAAGTPARVLRTGVTWDRRRL